MGKICNKCGLEKELIEFYTDNTKKDRYTRACKRCSLKSANKWKEDNPERVKKYTELYDLGYKEILELWKMNRSGSLVNLGCYVI